MIETLTSEEFISKYIMPSVNSCTEITLPRHSVMLRELEYLGNRTATLELLIKSAAKHNKAIIITEAPGDND